MKKVETAIAAGDAESAVRRCVRHSLNCSEGYQKVFCTETLYPAKFRVFLHVKALAA